MINFGPWTSLGARGPEYTVVEAEYAAYPKVVRRFSCVFKLERIKRAHVVLSWASPMLFDICVKAQDPAVQTKVVKLCFIRTDGFREYTASWVPAFICGVIHSKPPLKL